VSGYSTSCNGDVKIVQTITLSEDQPFTAATEEKYRNHVKASLDTRNLGNLFKDEVVVLDDNKAKATMTVEVPAELEKNDVFLLARAFDKNVEGLNAPETKLLCKNAEVKFQLPEDTGSELRFKVAYASANLPQTDQDKRANKVEETSELKSFFTDKNLTNCTVKSQGLSAIANVADKSFFTFTIKSCEDDGTKVRSNQVAKDFITELLKVPDMAQAEKAKYPTLKLTQAAKQADVVVAYLAKNTSTTG
jgi:hypothetical protein